MVVEFLAAIIDWILLLQRGPFVRKREPAKLVKNYVAA